MHPDILVLKVKTTEYYLLCNNLYNKWKCTVQMLFNFNIFIERYMLYIKRQNILQEDNIPGNCALIAVEVILSIGFPYSSAPAT